jgi:hypothetical protein
MAFGIRKSPPRNPNRPRACPESPRTLVGLACIAADNRPDDSRALLTEAAAIATSTGAHRVMR